MDESPNIDDVLEVGYREMARDEEREAVALEWVEAMIGDVGDLSDDSDAQSAE
jgi:hypothetical protein